MPTARNARHQKKIGNCVLAERRPRAGSGYSKALHRLREIDQLIADRFGQFVPAEYFDEFLTVAAFCCGGNTSAALNWCHRFAPYAVPTFDQAFEPIRRRIEGRRWNLSVEDAGKLLALTFDERQRLRIKTMWAADMPIEDQKAAIEEAKREKDRLRLAEKREAKRKPRAEWLAEHSIQRTRPWEAEGISESTWYRRRKADDKGVSRHAQADDKGVSRIENTFGVLEVVSDTPLSTPPIAPDFHDLQTAGGAPRAAVTEDTEDAV